jgi:hypothetical protein
MQAIGLATGDDFLASYNLTTDTEDVLSYLMDLLPEWGTRGTHQEAYFDDTYSVHFAIVAGPTGFCYDFNVADPGSFLNLDLYVYRFSLQLIFESFIRRLPSQFNYTRSVKKRYHISKYRKISQDPDQPYPMKVGSYQSGFFSYVQLVPYFPDKIRYDRNHHESLSTTKESTI